MKWRIRLTAALAMTLLAGAGPSAAADGLLVDAIERADEAAVRALLAEQVDPEAAEADGSTPLHWAVHHDQLGIAELLIRAGARATVANRYGVQPLSLACINGNPATIELLLDAGADPNTVLAEGETALMTAARTGVVEAVNVLLAHGADVNATESWRGQTALMWAAAEGNAEVVAALLAHGADVGAASQSGFTPLLFAAREGRIEVAERLLDAGASLDDSLSINSDRTAGGVEMQRASSEGLDAFLLAVGSAHFELAALLLERGADPNVAPRGWTALHQVSWVRKTGDSGSNDPAPEGSGEMDSLEFVRMLAAKGADLNARVTLKPPAGITTLNMLGGTPFLLAARTADAALMSLLAELGADPLLANEDNTTPLMVAAGVGTQSPGEDPGTEPEVLEAVEVALALGGDLNAVDDNGETAMHGAAYKHLPAVVSFLADRGARIGVWNQENAKGWTPWRIVAGVQRGSNIVSSTETEAAVRAVMARAGVAPPADLP